MKTTCETIKDLLPLYHDNVCSGESRILVEKHIEKCALCAKQLSDISAELNCPVNKSDEEKPLKALKKVLKKGRILAFIAGSIAAVIVVSAVAVSLMRVVDNNSYESHFQYYLEGTLPAGKYYMNGDSGSFYYEIFNDGTMQLFGGELSDLSEWDMFAKYDRERDFERFNYTAVSYSLTRRGYFAVNVNTPDDMPWQFNSSRYIYRDVSSIEEITAEPHDIFAEIIGGNAFAVWGHVFIRKD
jgi:hypothetical protein